MIHSAEHIGFIIQQEDVRPFLENHRLDTIDPNVWDLLQHWTGNATFNLVSIGISFAEHTKPTPPTRR